MPTKGKSVLAKVLGAVAWFGAYLDSLEARGERRAQEKWGDKDGLYASVRQTQTVLTIVTLGIVGIIGVLIYSQVSTSLPAPTDSNLSNTSTDIDAGFADALGLLPVVLIIMMAALVIAVVQRFRG